VAAAAQLAQVCLLPPLQQQPQLQSASLMQLLLLVLLPLQLRLLPQLHQHQKRQMHVLSQLLLLLPLL
jgi:hypothetical protein